MLSDPCDGRSARPSPRGGYVGFIRNASILRLNAQDWHGGLHTSASCIPNAASKVASLKWSANGSQILIAHDDGVLVVDSVERAERARLENGTAGFGQIASADFVGNDHLLAIWEFGNARLFNTVNGKSFELPDVKVTGNGRNWEVRPRSKNSATTLLAVLSRSGADDFLLLHIPGTSQAFVSVKLPTTDAQSLSWSPVGTWIAILDSAAASPNVLVYTPDGHFFRSYPTESAIETGLGLKSITWSPDGRILALARYDNIVELLNTETFSLVARIEHNNVIDQSSLSAHSQMPIWQENVSASKVRSYSRQTQPISLPITKASVEVQPKALGVIEMCFNCTGSHLASRDGRMHNTVWFWDTVSFAPYAVVLQHGNVRCLQWHPTKPELLLIDCAEGSAHMFDVGSSNPPVALPTEMKERASLSWLATAKDSKPVILIAEAHRFRLLFPEGRDEHATVPDLTSSAQDSAAFEEEPSEDSLLDVLSGRKPLPPKTEPSYTEMVDLAAEAEDSLSEPVEDTFREKKKPLHADVEPDPFDDSEIF